MRSACLRLPAVRRCPGRMPEPGGLGVRSDPGRATRATFRSIRCSYRVLCASDEPAYRPGYPAPAPSRRRQPCGERPAHLRRLPRPAAPVLGPLCPDARGRRNEPWDAAAHAQSRVCRNERPADRSTARVWVCFCGPAAAGLGRDLGETLGCGAAGPADSPASAGGASGASATAVSGASRGDRGYAWRLLRRRNLHRQSARVAPRQAHPAASTQPARQPRPRAQPPRLLSRPRISKARRPAPRAWRRFPWDSVSCEPASFRPPPVGPPPALRR